MNTNHLKALTRAAGDVCSLISLADGLATEAEAGDTDRVHVLAALIRAALVQARALHKQADATWIEAYRAEGAHMDLARRPAIDGSAA